MTKEVVLCENLSKVYRIRVLGDVNLSIMEGDIVGLVDESGAAKTTLMELCEGIREPDSGTVTVLGHKMPTQRKRVKSDIGVSVILRSQEKNVSPEDDNANELESAIKDNLDSDKEK